MTELLRIYGNEINQKNERLKSLHGIMMSVKRVEYPIPNDKVLKMKISEIEKSLQLIEGVCPPQARLLFYLDKIFVSDIIIKEPAFACVGIFNNSDVLLDIVEIDFSGKK